MIEQKNTNRRKHYPKVGVIFALLLVVLCSSMTTQAATQTLSKKLIQGQSWTAKVKWKKVKWKSSNKRIATVTNKGKITAKRNGTVTVTAKSGKNTYKYKIKVYAILSKKQAQKAVLNYCKKRNYPYYCGYGIETKGNNYWVWIRYGSGAQGKYVVNKKTGNVKVYAPYWGKMEDRNLPARKEAEFQALYYLP